MPNLKIRIAAFIAADPWLPPDAPTWLTTITELIVHTHIHMYAGRLMHEIWKMKKEQQQRLPKKFWNWWYAKKEGNENECIHSCTAQSRIDMCVCVCVCVCVCTYATRFPTTFVHVKQFSVRHDYCHRRFIRQILLGGYKGKTVIETISISPIPSYPMPVVLTTRLLVLVYSLLDNSRPLLHLLL